MLKSVEIYKNRQNYLHCYLSLTSFPDTPRSSTLPEHSYLHNLHHYLVKMRFSSLLTALSLAAIAQCLVASNATTVDKKGCITADQIEATYNGMLYLTQQYDIPFPADFPDTKDFLGKESKECVPESVTIAAANSMSRVSKEHDLESKYAQLTARSPAQLFKRTRTCKEMEDESQMSTSNTWSCRSAPSFSSCKGCVALATLGFLSGIAVCTSKQVIEAVPCCVLATTVYIGAYSNVCLKKD